MTGNDRTAVSAFFVATVTWVLASPLLYGFHIVALNQIQIALQCPTPDETAPLSPISSFPTCIPMSNAAFGFVTSIFTIGGLLGSLSSTYFMNRFGRKGAAKCNALFILAGSAILTVTWNASLLVLGRFVVGIGAGIAMCVGPVFLSEIAPEKIKGSVGVLNQMSVVLGLLLAQTIGLFLSTPGTHQWRIVFLVSAGLCALQILLSAGVSDTPHWLTAVGRDTEARAVAAKLHQDGATGISTARSPSARARSPRPVEAQRLLDEGDVEAVAENGDATETSIKPLTVTDLFKLEPLRAPVIAILLCMFSQQISGINAVIFFSNSILSRVVPGAEGYISLGIAVLNVFMTFPAIYLVESLGRRKLLLSSMTAVLISLVALGVGLNGGYTALSSFAILAFVGSFAIGLGPVPFVLIGELVPFYAASATSSLALSLNWITNFVVGVGFLPIRDWLSTPDPSMPSGRRGEGTVFYGFAVIFAVCGLVFSRLYRK